MRARKSIQPRDNVEDSQQILNHDHSPPVDDTQGLCLLQTATTNEAINQTDVPLSM